MHVVICGYITNAHGYINNAHGNAHGYITTA